MSIKGIKEGDVVECLDSKSNAYIKGNTYEVYKTDDGLQLKGEDGLFDYTNKLVSSFKKVDATGASLHKLKAVK